MEIDSAVEILAALAQGSRLAALRLLIERGPSGLPAGDIADRLGLPASTTSFHLSALERAGLVLSTRQGRQIIYAVRFAAASDVTSVSASLRVNLDAKLTTSSTTLACCGAVN